MGTPRKHSVHERNGGGHVHRDGAILQVIDGLSEGRLSKKEMQQFG